MDFILKAKSAFLKAIKVPDKLPDINLLVSFQSIGATEIINENKVNR